MITASQFLWALPTISHFLVLVYEVYSNKRPLSLRLHKLFEFLKLVTYLFSPRLLSYHCWYLWVKLGEYQSTNWLFEIWRITLWHFPTQSNYIRIVLISLCSEICLLLLSSWCLLNVACFRSVITLRHSVKRAENSWVRRNQVHSISRIWLTDWDKTRNDLDCASINWQPLVDKQCVNCPYSVITFHQ